ncbi:MAG TPA: gamma-glutamyl-gamma-aminobutyrate hydrolase family protein [Terracidiphilus sp.]|jgi:putative glutamine amidotransferase|nr:gamma-glutamyl-gamma-aminobutyrate hydrolase family protein [Terracidiphilus sp.]
MPSPRIAIPEPTSTDPAYNSRALPQYIRALQSAGAVPVVIPLTERPDRVARLLATVRGALLPGSPADVDPQTYGQSRTPACNPSDSVRAAVDELLLQDAFNLRKPLLAICYGVQSLNVWRGGSLIQDLAAEGKTAINHAPGRAVDQAHAVQIAGDSRLARLAARTADPVYVNSSHHQALNKPGDNLRVIAVSSQDSVIEAVELNSLDHFVLGVQWHPERTYTSSELSRAIFSSLIQAAAAWSERPAPMEVPSL